MELLKTLLDRLAGGDYDLASELAQRTRDELTSLRNQVYETYASLTDALDSEDVDEATVTKLEHLADIAEAVTTAVATVDDDTTEAEALTQPDQALDVDSTGDEVDDPSPAELDTTSEERRDRATQAAERLTNTQPTQQDTPAEAAVHNSPVSAPVEATSVTSTEKELEPVAASASAVSLKQIPSSGGILNPGGHTVSYTVHAADIPGLPVGAKLDDIKALAAAATARMQGLSRVGPGRSAQAGIATIQRQVDEDRLYVNDNDTHVVDQVCNEASLPGGSLVAAGCWCAPSETLYDIGCNIASVDGLVDLPEVVTQRGGIRYPVVPDFSEIYSQIGFHFDCAALEGDPNAEPPVPPAEKPCYEIPCLDMQDQRLDVEGLCLKTPILTERAWPELVEYFMAQALAAHQHKINAWVLAKMVALSTKVDITSQVTGLPNPHGPSATSSILSIIELYVEHIKLKYRLPQATSLEMVAPRWLKGVLRADLSKRLCVDMLQVTDQMLNQHLALRGVRVQWVLDWQCAFAIESPPPQPADGIIQPVGTGLGGPDYPQAWPSEVQILLYPAGSLFRMSADVITLDGIYDSVQLSHNEYTKLFTEEGVQVAKRCYEPVALTIPTCPNGGNGPAPYLACTSTA